MSIKRIIAALSILSLCLSGCGQAVQVPNAELSGADPAVIKKFDKARESVNENPKSAAAWGHLGILFNAYGLMDQAIDCYQRAAELDPQEFRWSYLSAVLLAERDPEQAETELRRAAEINSQYAPLFCNLAMAFVKTGRDDEAQQEYETALRIDPKCRQALLGLGELKLQIGEFEQSREYFMKAADLKFEDHQVHTLLARLYNRMRDQKSAEIEQNLARAYPQAAPPRDEIRALVQAEATGIGNLVDRGSALLKNGRFAEAETVFRRVIAQRKGTADDHEQLGRALAEQGQLKEAIKEL